MEPWNKSLNFIFPTKYVIPKSLKFSHWPSKCSRLRHASLPLQTANTARQSVTKEVLRMMWRWMTKREGIRLRTCSKSDETSLNMKIIKRCWPPPRRCFLQCFQIKSNQCLEVTKFILRDLSIFFRKSQLRISSTKMQENFPDRIHQNLPRIS